VGRWAGGQGGRWAGGQVGRWAGGQVGRCGGKVGPAHIEVKSMSNVILHEVKSKSNDY